MRLSSAHLYCRWSGRSLLALQLILNVFRPISRPPTLLGFISASLLLGLMIARTSLAREHRVRPGQNLARIAKTYKVRPAALAAANRLESNAALRAGTVLRVPDEGEEFVAAGDTLEEIARAHGVDANELARANGLRAGARLRIGTRLTLPGFEARGWGRPRNPGMLNLRRVGLHESVRIKPLDTRGRMRARALRSLAHLLRFHRIGHAHHGEMRTPPERLIKLVIRVSDYFGGRPVHVVSGYRAPGGHTRRESRHTSGDAIDFKIPGVPLTALREYARTLDKTGVGYYPNSGFIHLDVRDESVHWTDWSGPGEAPRYGRRDPSAATPEASDVASQTDGAEITASDELTDEEPSAAQ